MVGILKFATLKANCLLHYEKHTIN